jgi:hypothetical protein
MQPLYKYSKREHIEALTRDGTIWLGTLHGFRVIESKMIGDKDEGKLELTREFGRRNTLVAPYETYNLWLYCTSYRLLSLAEAQNWDPTYNACAEIHDPENFGRLIANALEKAQHALRRVEGCEVVYRERVQPFSQHDGIDPACIKPPCYASQYEYRFGFDPVELPKVKGMLLPVPGLEECCRMLRDEEMPT